MFSSALSWWGALPEYVKNAVYVVVLFYLILRLVSWLYTSAASTSTENARLVMLVKTATRWAAMAEQDTSPLLAMQHADYAAAYLQVLKELHDTSSLQNATGGVDFHQLQRTVLELQNRVQTKLGEVCPTVQPDSVLEAYSLM